MGNIELARRLIVSLRSEGVDEFCVCAGSRNSPLLAVLGSEPTRLFSFVDERSAAFFALGRMKLHGGPVAVVTTSGTAAAELLPAAIEAHYSALPLILVTADRPAAFRGTGAPQSIEQPGIFGVYAKTDLEQWPGRGPLHLNIEFDEPLLDEPLYPAPNRSEGAVHGAQDTTEEAAVEIGRAPLREREHSVAGFSASPADTLERLAHPLVILGALPGSARDKVARFVRGLNAPTYAEPLSGLREDPTLPLIRSGERMIRRGTFDGVIRVGGIPTLRYWRDLESSPLPVVHYSDVPFTGLTRGGLYPLKLLPEEVRGRHRDERFFAEDELQAGRLQTILDAEPGSELAMLRELSRTLQPGSRVFLGNSLPIREWDLVASRESKGIEYAANRGANGIDGQLSTFFGWCAPGRENVCVVGDLTTIYDLGAPWIVRQLDAPFRIVVVNNGGGRIFGRVPSLQSMDRATREQIVENVHEVRFDGWASMWGIESSLIELRPDADASARAWRRYDELWA